MNVKIRHLNIEVTKRCNQRCFYCFNNSGLGSPGSELTPTRWLNILRKLKDEGLESIHLTGGEPFAYKHAVELLTGAQELGLATSILSNGFRVIELAGASPEVFRKLTVAQISLDSMKAETHNQRRGSPRAWDDALGAITVLRQLAIPVEISCVVSDENLPDLPAVADFADHMGAALIIRPMLAAGRAANIKPSDTFDLQLHACVEMISSHHPSRVVADRFHYVSDELKQRLPSIPDDVHTVHHNGVMILGDNRDFNLMSLAAYQQPEYLHG